MKSASAIQTTDNLLTSGLVSISFRNNTADDIITAAVDAQLCSIEWGGDIHVPHGDMKIAADVARKTMDAGLVTAAYGSYYRLVESEKSGLPYRVVLDTALVLQAPLIRIWAGTQASSIASHEYVRFAEEEAFRIAELSAEAGIKVAFEFHNRTLADTAESTCALLKAVNHPALKTLWQPKVGFSPERNKSDLQSLIPWLENVHAFHWTGDCRKKPLAEGFVEWSMYMEVLREFGCTHSVLLEFFHDDSFQALKEDSATLHRILEAVSMKV